MYRLYKQKLKFLFNNLWLRHKLYSSVVYLQNQYIFYYNDWLIFHHIIYKQKTLFFYDETPLFNISNTLLEPKVNNTAFNNCFTVLKRICLLRKN